MKITTRFMSSAFLAGSVNVALLSLLSASLPAHAAAASVAAAASAAPEVELRQRVVHFGDLDLSQDAGVALLYRRIRAAAREVCAAVDEHELYQVELSRRCAQEAIERAVADVNSPALVSYGDSKLHSRRDAVP